MNTTEGSGGKLAGKIALITGGTSGIGLATAKRFVAEGAYVFITGRREAELASAEREIGRNVRAIQSDVARLEDLDRLFAQIQQLKGRLDVIFANAGTARFGALGTITEEFFDSLFGANVKGLLFTVQKALPLMPPGGVIVLNASVGGYKGRPANGVYSATKAAVRSFARTWTNDLKDRQIRVNAISPGVTETQGFRDLMNSSSASDIETQRQRAISSIPLGRLGTPETSPRWSYFWRARTAATLPALRSRSTVVLHRFKRARSLQLKRNYLVLGPRDEQGPRREIYRGR